MQEVSPNCWDLSTKLKCGISQNILVQFNFSHLQFQKIHRTCCGVYIMWHSIQVPPLPEYNLTLQIFWTMKYKQHISFFYLAVILLLQANTPGNKCMLNTFYSYRNSDILHGSCENKPKVRKQRFRTIRRARSSEPSVGDVQVTACVALTEEHRL
jgi:hypothetical protein